MTGAITAGQLVSRTGRYKIFPIIGLVVVTVGMTLLATLPLQASLVTIGAYMALSGFGIGLVMPVMLVTVQNAVEPRDLGVGTASISFFRSMGGSFGVALFGAVLIARLNHWIAQAPDLATALGAEPGIRLLHAGSGALDLAPAALHPALAEAMLRSFHEVFGLGAAIAVLALIVFLLLREIPLRTTAGMGSDEVPVGAPAD